ncbi:peptide deformylase [Oscillochloris trichoides DG-6]|uniref:Peptide deformylase n=1 Tax=Oscillochloris trichoides DG-6 TaxID=765420 RepID=E1IAW5_9CHLR|nr:peptide deformylase [Oscillochloris trichoides]EFO81611.1 peptide deformylase [Oscillochloris trichoides DG-6]
MSTRRILRIDNPEDKKTLKMQCRPVKLPDRNLKQLVADMFETMRKSHGVGLAAPQVGLPIQLCIIEIPAEIEQRDDGTEVEVAPAEEYVLINPRIVKTSGDEIMRDEGCLSLPGWYGMVPRHSWVTVEYQDFNGKQHRLRKADGLLGWAIQHEVDHLHGVLFTERIRDLSTLRDVSKQPDDLVAA